MNNIEQLINVVLGAIGKFFKGILFLYYYLFIGLLIITVYLLPTGVSLLKKRENTAAIFTLNLLLGWTLIGWVVSLVWSLKSDYQKVLVTHEQR